MYEELKWKPGGGGSDGDSDGLEQEGGGGRERAGVANITNGLSI